MGKKEENYNRKYSRIFVGFNEIHANDSRIVTLPTLPILPLLIPFREFPVEIDA